MHSIWQRWTGSVGPRAGRWIWESQKLSGNQAGWKSQMGLIIWAKHLRGEQSHHLSPSRNNEFATLTGPSLVAQMVKKLLAMLETQVRPLGWEDPLEKETATHSSILAWRIPWTEELGRLPCMGLQRVGHDWMTNNFTFTGVQAALWGPYTQRPWVAGRASSCSASLRTRLAWGPRSSSLCLCLPVLFLKHAAQIPLTYWRVCTFLLRRTREVLGGPTLLG